MASNSDGKNPTISGNSRKVEQPKMDFEGWKTVHSRNDKNLHDSYDAHPNFFDDDDEMDVNLQLTQIIEQHKNKSSNSEASNPCTLEEENLDTNREGETQARESPVANIPLPMNPTLESEGLGKVIIIEPLGENPSQLTNNPIAIIKALKNSPFDAIKNKKVRVNKRKKIIVIEMKESEEKLCELTRIEQIDKWKVKCYQPLKDVLKQGVISPVDIEVSVDELLEYVSIEQGGSSIFSLKRLKKKVNGNWIDSSCVNCKDYIQR